MTLNYIAIGVLFCIPWIITFIIVSGGEGGKLWKLRQRFKAPEEHCDLCGSTNLSAEPIVSGHKVTCECGRSWWTR